MKQVLMSKLLVMISELLVGSQSYLLRTGILLEKVVRIFLFGVSILYTETRNYVGFSSKKKKVKQQEKIS